MPSDKQNYHTIEYATISGAGKSRYVLRQLGGDSKFHNIPMSLVALNFNGGTGGGSDLSSVQETTLPTNAMSRLLLSRGLFGVHPDMQFLTGSRMSDESLPPLQQVIDALFLDRFSDPSGEGLLVVHLDELWLLKKIKEDQWIKDFICSLLEYSVKSSSGGRYVLPVVTHTCPDNNLLLNPEFKSNLYAPKSLCLYPFSLKQSVDLIAHLRCESVGDAEGNIDLPRWEKVIALAGGHPSLLVGSFHLLTNQVIVEHNPTTESAVCMALVANEKMQRFEKSIKNLTSEDAADFIQDCLLLRDVKFEKHSKCLNSGIGWFQPNENGTTGRVSTPFPVLVSLMAWCSDQKFSNIAAALNPSAAGFSPTKAMEYVSALAVVLHRTRSIDSWRSCPLHDAFQALEKSTDDFFTVWKLPNQAVLDFGGIHDGWKILGQSKMQEPGADTAQALKEVLDMAWRIGDRVKKNKLSGKLHAYWVSSRKAQKISQLRKLICACRVAMSGILSKAEATQQLERYEEKLNVSKFIDLLASMNTNPDYLFTYVGDITVDNIADDRNGDRTKKARTADVDGSILNMEDLLPKGVFAAWG